MPGADPLLDSIFPLQVLYPARDVADVLGVDRVALRVGRGAGLGVVRGVRREAVVETCYAGDGGYCGGVGGEQVFEGGLNAFRVLQWVAPGAAVDVDEPWEIWWGVVKWPG